MSDALVTKSMGLFLFEVAGRGFSWSEGILALAVTALVMLGLVLVEAVHQPAKLRSVPPLSPETTDEAGVARSTNAGLFQDLPRAERVAWGRALFAGLLATAVMSALLAWVPSLGAPKLDTAAMLATVLAGNVAMGWAAHFSLGVVLAAIYALWFCNALSGPTWIRGAVYGVLPFIAAQLVIIPMMGGGFFSSAMPQAGALVLLSFAAHVVYGAVLGLVYGNPIFTELSSPSPEVE